MSDQADGFDAIAEAIDEADVIEKEQKIEENKDKVMISYPPLTYKQWQCVQTVAAAALFGFWPELWIKNPTDDAVYHMQRQIIAEAMLSRAEEYFRGLGREGADELRLILKSTAEAAMESVGIDPAEMFEKTTKFMESLGLRVKHVEQGPDETTFIGEASSDGDTPEESDGRGSEPNTGSGQDLA
jgi:hypothetical protein